MLATVAKSPASMALNSVFATSTVIGLLLGLTSSSVQVEHWRA
jgi:hypothetical protein